MRERVTLPSAKGLFSAKDRSRTTAGSSASTLLGLQRRIGNRATSDLLRTPILQRLPVKTKADRDSEFAMGTAVALENIVKEKAAELGIDGAVLTLGGGAGVWALRPGRAVQDLDFRLSCPGGTGKDQALALIHAVEKELVDATLSLPTLKGKWGVWRSASRWLRNLSAAWA